MSTSTSPTSQTVAPVAPVAFQKKPEAHVEVVAPVPKAPADTKVNMLEALKNLGEVELWLKQFSGKPGYNPHFCLVEKVNPLKAKITNGDKSPETYVAAMALKAGDESLAKPPTIPAPHGFIDHTRRGW